MSTLKPLIEANKILQENASLKKDIRVMTTLMGIAALLTIGTAYTSYRSREIIKKMHDEQKRP